MIKQYFRRKKNNVLAQYKNKIHIPNYFYIFYSEYNPVSIIDEIKPHGYTYIGFGIERDRQFIYFGDFLEVEEMETQLKYDLTDYVMKFNLLKIGNNEYTEGGIYIGIGDNNLNQIFYYQNYLEIASSSEILKMADSFEGLLKESKLYGVNFINEETVYTELNIDLKE